MTMTSRMGADPQSTMEMWSYAARASSGSLCAMPGPGVLGRVIIGGGTLGQLTIYDNTAASGTVLLTITGPSAGHTYFFNAMMSKGASVQAAAATNIVVTYRM